MVEEIMNIQVDEAINGLEAVEQFKKRMNKKCQCINRLYKVIFMDIQMPIMDGIESCR